MYKLLEVGDIMEAGDEYYSCHSATWKSVGRYAGKSWPMRGSVRKMPVRRKVSNTNDALKNSSAEPAVLLRQGDLRWCVECDMNIGSNPDA